MRGHTRSGIFWFAIYIIFGVYLINYPLGFLLIPEAVSNFDQWIIFVGGILILLGGINHFRVIQKKRQLAFP